MVQVKLYQEEINIKFVYKMNVTFEWLPFFALLRRIMVLGLVVIF